MKENRGITLIALVITIVVLIILATISISVIFGEDGIISRAEGAQDEHRAGTVQDQVAMWKSEKTLASKTSGTARTRTQLLDELVTQGLLTTKERQEVEETGQTTIGSQTIIFGSNARTLVELYDAGELKIGDYVNFPNPTSGTYTSPGTQTGMQERKDDGRTVENEDLNQVYNVANNQLNWRVLGKDESGGLKLIAGSPMKKETTNNNPYLMMYGAQSYLTGIQEFNNISNLYRNEYTSSARSINMDDINQITGITTEEKIKEVNLDAYHGNKQYGDPYSFANQYTPESWLNGKTQTTVSGTVDGYYYSVNSKVETDAPQATISDTRVFNMLFENVDVGRGKAYRLASRGVPPHSSGALFGPGVVGSEDGVTYAFSDYAMFHSDGDAYGVGFAVRPVVILKSDITEEQIQKIEDKTEETWNYAGGAPQ